MSRDLFPPCYVHKSAPWWASQTLDLSRRERYIGGESCFKWKNVWVLTRGRFRWHFCFDIGAHDTEFLSPIVYFCFNFQSGFVSGKNIKDFHLHYWCKLRLPSHHLKLVIYRLKRRHTRWMLKYPNLTKSSAFGNWAKLTSPPFAVRWNLRTSL